MSERRNDKWDITHKDMRGGRMLLIKHSTGERRTLPRTQAALTRSKIAKIEDMWGEEAGPKHLYRDHHKHIDAALEPYFENIMRELVNLNRSPLLIETACDSKKSGKPWRTPGGPKKFAVCDTDEGGKKKLVRFGSSTMEIKRDDPGRRKNFRARHRCDKAPPASGTPRKWACKTWEAGKSVGAIVN